MGKKSGKQAIRKAGKSAPSTVPVPGRPPVGGMLNRRIHAALGLLLIAPALLPLLYVPGFLYPFAAPKTFAFRALGILVLAAFSWLMLAGSEFHYGRLRQKITWIPAALLGVMYATSLSGLGFHHSFWSNFERGDGLLTFTVIVGFFYATLLHAEAGVARRIALVSMCVANVVALIAFLQWLNFPDRVGSTFGNAAYMASYLGMTFFLTLWLVRENRGWWRGVVLAAAGLQLFAIFVLSATRGTMLALVIAAVVAAGFAAWKMQGRARLAARLALAGMLVVFALIFVFRAQLASVPFLPLQRVAAALAQGSTGAGRLPLWEMLGGQAMQHPFVGVGAEHVEDVYNAVYQPGGTAEWVDRSHNVLLDYFVQFGAFGALLYLALVVAALRAAYLSFRAGNRAGGYFLLLGVTYAVQNFFTFDTAHTLWLFLAVLASTLAGEKSTPTALKLPAVPAAVRLLAVLAMLLLLFPVVIQPARANLLLNQAYAYSVADAGRSVSNLEAGLALNTYADLEYGYNAYQMYAREQATQLTGEARLLAHRTTQEILSRNFARYEYDARTAAYLAHFVGLTPAESTPDIALQKRAIERAMRLSRGRVELPYFRANMDISKGDAAGAGAERNTHYLAAISTLTDYLGVQPGRPDIRYVIASLYLSMGDAALARKWSDEGDAAFDALPDVYSARRAARYHMNASQWVKATRFLQFLVDKDPTEYTTMLTLAKARYLVGDRAGARAIVDQLRVKAPILIEREPGFAALVDANQD